MQRRIEIPPAAVARTLALERELGVSFPVAQVLVRRGLGDLDAARAWLAAGEAHDPGAFAGIDRAIEVIREHAARGAAITVHGDYDVDGICSTAILVEALRGLGARVDWFLPSRAEDGYGLSAATVERLAARGTELLITADCAITAVAEVARARELGMAVVVTDHHQARASGELPDAPIVHPAVCGYPCPELCAAGVAHKLAVALGADPAGHMDLVALATVADCVPLVGENRRLVREGLRALATTRREGLRALMRVARCDPGALDATAIGFRLAPRLNAAGRLHRADAGLELVLCEDRARAEQIAAELDAANAERRHTETRILFEAEAQVAEAGDQPGYVLAAEGWHAGVIGIVASRIAERHHRPVVLIALPPGGGPGTGSGRSIPAFDLLAGLDACAAHLERHGGHRAAAGCTIAPERVAAFRAAFVAHAAAALSSEDLVPCERVDAVVAGDELGLTLAEELERLAPFGIGNPAPSLLVPAASLQDARTMGEGKHLRFTLQSGGARARAVAFGTARLPEGHEGPLDATFALERNEWNGAVEPRLVLRHACAPAPAAIEVVGEPTDEVQALQAELDALLADPAPAPPRVAPGWVRDRRGGGVAGTIAALVASGEPVLVACADARLRARHLAGRLGGFRLVSWLALERDPALLEGIEHLVALDPPACPAQEALQALAPLAHLAYGPAETAFAHTILQRDFDLRAPLAALYRTLRDTPGCKTRDYRGFCSPPGAFAPAQAGRMLRIFEELGLVEVDRGAGAITLLEARRTRLEASETFRAATRRLDAGRAALTTRTSAVAA
jgi:single-stranded-DNA-specific exonuclease